MCTGCQVTKKKSSGTIEKTPKVTWPFHHQLNSREKNDWSVQLKSWVFPSHFFPLRKPLDLFLPGLCFWLRGLNPFPPLPGLELPGDGPFFANFLRPYLCPFLICFSSQASCFSELLSVATRSWPVPWRADFLLSRYWPSWRKGREGQTTRIEDSNTAVWDWIKLCSRKKKKGIWTLAYFFFFELYQSSVTLKQSRALLQQMMLVSIVIEASHDAESLNVASLGRPWCPSLDSESRDSCAPFFSWKCPYLLCKTVPNSSLVLATLVLLFAQFRQVEHRLYYYICFDHGWFWFTECQSGSTSTSTGARRSCTRTVFGNYDLREAQTQTGRRQEKLDWQTSTPETEE